VHDRARLSSFTFVTNTQIKVLNKYVHHAAQLFEHFATVHKEAKVGETKKKVVALLPHDSF